MDILADNKKLVKEFGASRIDTLKKIPDCYTFTKGLIYSHRDFDKFLTALEKGEKCAIVSGLNASGSLHLGHKVIFDTNLYFQKKYNIPIFIPISDDESYVAKKVESQEEAYKYSIELAKELLAYGFDPKNTYFIIDQVYTNIYNLAIKLSAKINISQIKAVYGYKNEENIGLHFYPAIQSAHILFPQEQFNIKHVIVPIGPDEDAHLRVCRDIAAKMSYNKPAVLHLSFMAGTDGAKMSKSKNNAIFFKSTAKEIKKKVNKSLSGGQETVELHRELGGNTQNDMAFQYLSKFFLTAEESKELAKEYESGNILSGEMKAKLIEKLNTFLETFQSNLEKVTDDDLNKCILTNDKALKMKF